MRRMLLMTAASLVLAASALAQDAPVSSGGPGERVIPNFSKDLPNVSGKSLIALEVDYAPGGKSLPHHHAPSAFVYAYVVAGSIRSQVAGGPVRVYKTGESFFEDPGSHHLIGENASATEPAKLLAVFVVDSDHKALTIPDK